MFFEPLAPILEERERMLDEDLDSRVEAIVRLDQATVSWSMFKIPTALRLPAAHDLPDSDVLNEARSRHIYASAQVWRDAMGPIQEDLLSHGERYRAAGDADAEFSVHLGRMLCSFYGMNCCDFNLMVSSQASLLPRVTDRRSEQMILGVKTLVRSRQAAFVDTADDLRALVEQADPATYALSGTLLLLSASRAARRDGCDPEPLRQEALALARWRHDGIGELFALRDEYSFGDPATADTIARMQEMAEMAGPGLADLYLGEAVAHLERDGTKLAELSVAAEAQGARGLAWDMAAGAQLFHSEHGDGAAALRAERRSHRLAALDPLARSPLHELMTPVLTDRETEVAQLVAEGLSSPQVADQLYLSPRTVGRHLERIYKKLGISSRGELAELVESLN